MKKFFAIMMVMFLTLSTLLPNSFVLADDEGITLEFNQAPSTRENTKEFLTGELMQSTIKFKANLPNEEFSGAYLSLTYPENLENVVGEIEANLDFNNSNVFSRQAKIGNELRIYFKDSETNDAKEAEFPVFLRFTTYKTPNNTSLPVTLSLKKADGSIVKTAGQNTFIGVVKQPSHMMSVRGGSSQIGGISSDGTVLDNNGLIDVYFDYNTRAKREKNIYSINANDVGERIYQSITLTQPLPEHGVFAQSKNPNWTYDAETNVATYTLDGKDYNRDLESFKTISLVLTFPGASLNKSYSVQSTMVYHPTDKPTYENEPVSQDHTSYSFSMESGQGNPFKKRFRANNDDTPASVIKNSFAKVTNTPERIRTGLDWEIIVAGEKTDTGVFTSFKDYDLDERLYYSGVSIPRTDDFVGDAFIKGDYKRLSNITVKAKMQDDSVQNMGTVSSGRKLNFTNTEVAKNIKELYFEFPDGTTLNHNEIVSFKIHTKFRETPVFLDSELENTYKNSGSYSAIYTRQNGTQYTFKGSDTTGFILQEPKPDIGIRKTLSERLGTGWFASQRDEPLRSDGEYAIWEIGQSGFNDAIKGMRDSDIIKEIQIVDLLPEGLTYKSTSGVSGATVEYVENYNDSGLNAVLITYKNIPVWRFNTIVENGNINIVTTVNSDSLPGKNLNTILIKVDGEFIKSTDTHHMYKPILGEAVKYVDTRDIDEDGDTKESFAAVQDYYTYTGRYELIARKYIAKDYRDNYIKTGIRTALEEKFKYKLFNYNNKLTDITSYEMIDLFPYVNDATSAQDAVTNTYKPRDSKFSNTMTGAVQFLSKNASKFTVYYTTDELTATVENPREALNWTTDVTDYTKVTGIRIVLNNGQKFKKGEMLEVTVPMKAPQTASSSAKAWNDFIITTDGDQFTPTNKVYNKIDVPSGFIKVIKLEKDTKEPLANVKFNVLDEQGVSLSNEDGTPMSIVTDEKGEAEIELSVGNYQFQEVVPFGYLAENQIMPITVVENETTPITIYNTKALGTIRVNKFDEDDNTKKLAGATFELKQNGKVISTKETNDDGIAEFTDIPYGDYSLVEKNPPTGYVKKDSIKVVVDDHKKPIEVEVSNKKNEIKAVKIDAENPDISIEGTEIALEDLENNKIVDKAVTNDEGVAVFKGIPNGNYRVKETRPSALYAIDKFAYEDITVSDDHPNHIIHLTNRKALNIKVKKEWIAKEDSKQPVVIQLKLKGEVVAEKTIEKDNSDFVSFNNLKRIDDEDRADLTDLYTVEEKGSVDNKIVLGGKTFESSISNITDSVENKEEFTVYYEVKNIEKTSFTARKTWNNGPLEKPVITLVLEQNGIDYQGVDAQKQLANGESEVIWENLPATDKDGDVYRYTVRELPVENYVTTYNEARNEVINTYIPPKPQQEKKDIEVNKVWYDDNDKDGKRPKEIIVSLIGNGRVLEKVKLNADMKWQYTFKDLLVEDENGKIIEYSIKEDEVEGYDAKIEGYTITNTIKNITIDEPKQDKPQEPKKEKTPPNTGDEKADLMSTFITMMLSLICMIVGKKIKFKR